MIVQLQLVVLNRDSASTTVQKISDQLGYIPMGEQGNALTIDREWWRRVLRTKPLGVVVDSEIETADGSIESNDPERILRVLDEGGEVLYITFARRFSSDEHPVLFSAMCKMWLGFPVFQLKSPASVSLPKVGKDALGDHDVHTSRVRNSLEPLLIGSYVSVKKPPPGGEGFLTLTEHGPPLVRGIRSQRLHELSQLLPSRTDS